MAKKKKHEEHENLERWLVSYADFMTLLFATFVVLYALAQTDVSELAKIDEALQRAFSRNAILQGQDGLMDGSQNIFDSQSIGSILKGYYKEANLLDSEFIFEIPLYKNMPTTIVKNPTLTSEKGELAYVNANGGLKLKDSPNGDTITIISEGTEILITERAKNKIGGYYWDKVSTPYGTGYMAREASDGSKTYLVLIKDKEDNTDKEENLGKEEPKNYKTEGTNMMIAPTTTIKELAGATNSSKVFGTGAQIKLGDKTYNLVMLGDTSKDGNISALDYVKVKNKIMGTTTMDDVTEKAADVNRDGKVSATDYVKIRNHIMNVSKITL